MRVAAPTIAAQELEARADSIKEAALGEEAWYFKQYGRVATHREMLEDAVRTRAFRKAIFAVCPGKVVLDVGCGSGVLSLFAAQAGATRVIAVEGSQRTAELAKEAVQRNGFAGVVTVIHGRVEDEATCMEVDAQVQRAGSAAGYSKVDVIVSEWMGYMLVHEDMFASVAFARDRWLAHGGLVMPASCSVWAAPFNGMDFIEELTGFWRRSPYGLDFSHLAKPAIEEILCRPVIDDLGRDRLLAPAARLWRLPCFAARSDEARAQQLPFEFEVDCKGRLHGLAVWFKCGLAPGIGFTTGPESEPTHWAQTMLFAGPRGGCVSPEGLAVTPGDRVSGELCWETVGRSMRVKVRGVVERGGANQRGLPGSFAAEFDWTLRPEP